MRNALMGLGVAVTLVGLATLSYSIGWGCIVTVAGFCLAAVCDADANAPKSEPKRSSYFEDGFIQ